MSRWARENPDQASRIAALPQSEQFWPASTWPVDKDATKTQDSPKPSGGLLDLADRMGLPSVTVFGPKDPQCAGCGHKPHAGAFCLHPSYVHPRGTCGHAS